MRFDRATGARCALLGLSLALLAATLPAAAAPTNAPIIGEIIHLTLDNPADIWSGGTMVVGGVTVILPRNLLVDLPANRLSLQQLFTEAPGACAVRGESGVARNDSCLGGNSGGIATIKANRTNGGNLIAGEVFIEKGVESVTGVVTYIDHTDGYFRVGGIPGDPATGTMVRINDPGSRHTVQQGLGCLAGSPNCSPDPRFTVDDVNYTVTSTTGYPLCIASTVTGGNRTTGSDVDGNGDPFCPVATRTVNNGRPVADSSRFAPILLGDHLTGEGNFETIDGTRFLSVHTLHASVGLTTSAGQPDYLTFDEAFWDVAGFQNERARAQFILFTTAPDSQLDVFARHFDRFTNQPVEYPVGSTVNNINTINQGIPPNQGGIARIRYDVDFLVGTVPDRSPCRNLNNAGFGACSSVPTIAEEFDILSPVAREVMARTRNKTDNPGLQAFDIQGNSAPWGEYFTPIELDFPNFLEINLAAVETPFIFAGIPWNLDRRLSPDGCVGACESLPQPLDPFPFSGLDPRTQAGVPAGVEDQIFAFHPFGPTDFLPWPPADPAALPIAPTPDPVNACGITNYSPVAGGDRVTTDQDTAVTFDVTVNDSDIDGLVIPATVTLASTPGNGVAVANGDGTVTYAPNAGFTGDDAFSYTVADDGGAISNAALVQVKVLPPNVPPTAANDMATTDQDTAVTIAVLANDSDSDGLLDPGTVTVVTAASNGATVVNLDGTVTYTPNAGFNGGDAFTYTVADDRGGVSNAATVSLTVLAPPPADVLTVTNAQYSSGPARWQVSGTATITTNNQVTIYNGPTVGGVILGVATVQADGTWSFDERNHPTAPDATQTISVQSSAGGVLEGVPVTVK